jgi:hypothetical protein
MDIYVPTLRPAKTTRWRGVFRLEWCIKGQIFLDDADNQLYDQGEQDVLELYTRGGTAPTVFQIGLLKTTYSLLETDTMTQVAAAEMLNAQNGGYDVRKTITRDNTGWPVSGLVGGDWQVSTAQVTWTATGAWADTAGFMFLAHDSTTVPGNTTGRVTAVAPLSPTRQLQAINDTLKVTYALKLQ